MGPTCPLVNLSLSSSWVNDNNNSKKILKRIDWDLQIEFFLVDFDNYHISQALVLKNVTKVDEGLKNQNTCVTSFMDEP